MKKVIHKWFWAWDYDKEEQWLNEMSAKGLLLTSVNLGRYEFKECEPGEYTLRLEMLKHSLNHPESESYIKFVEETGAEHFASFARWIYFRKKTADGPFELYSDNTSKINNITRILLFLLPITLLNLILGINNLYMAITDFSTISDINYIGIINILIFILGSRGCYKLYKKRKKLKKEAHIFE